MKKIIISKTGVIHGRGTERYKWISHLSQAEREHIRKGGTVLVKDKNASHYTQSGWKRVHFTGGRFSHREATPAQIRATKKK